MDQGVLIAIVTGSASVIVAGIAAFASIAASRQSTRNNTILTALVPTVEKVSKQTNHMQEVMQQQATALGVQTGRDLEKANPTP